MFERSFLILSIILLFSACESEKEKAQRIVDQAIDAHGLEKIVGDTVRFKFRKHHFTYYRDEKGDFHYERRSDPRTAHRYRDVLTNEGLKRFSGNKESELSSKDSAAYAESVNSVTYFAFVPYRLNDPAVRKKQIGTEQVGDADHHRVRVTFEEEGGGEDHDDVFLYWFEKESGLLNYFAYRYFRDGGGVRFREAYNRREKEGVLIQDYKNYKAPQDIKLRDLDEMWENGELEQVSTIELENFRFE